MMLRSLLDRLPGLGSNEVGEAQPDISSDAPYAGFFRWSQDVPSTGAVLEIGTRQAKPGKATHSQGEFPHVARERYVMGDIEDGADVDLVCDIHALPAEWTARFDAFVAIAVFEHLERPWIAAKEVARVLKPGGRCYVSTHQTYPLHGYPSDFFRFSREALKLIFEDAGIRTLDVAYRHRIEIIMPKAILPAKFARHWNRVWPSYLCVDLHGEKP